MKETTYEIKCSFNNKPVVKTIPGYTFIFCGIRFGVSAYYYSGETCKKGSTWRITELQSGLLYGGIEGTTRKAAIDKLVNEATNNPCFEQLKRRIAEHVARNGALNKAAEPDNEILTAKTFKRPEPPAYTETAAIKALKVLKNIRDARDLKRLKLTLEEYHSACVAANELVKAGKTETFISAVSAFFENHGCNVTAGDVNYTITA